MNTKPWITVIIAAALILGGCSNSADTTGPRIPGSTASTEENTQRSDAPELHEDIVVVIDFCANRSDRYLVDEDAPWDERQLEILSIMESAVPPTEIQDQFNILVASFRARLLDIPSEFSNTKAFNANAAVLEFEYANCGEPPE